MKNIAKLSVIALTVLSFAACDPTKKPATEGVDSTSATVKVDSNKTVVDSSKTDTVKKDTVKK